MSHSVDAVDSPLQVQRRGFKLLLLLGFLSCGIAVLSAYGSPATDYEVSIYHSTPVPFWVGVSTSFVAALFTAFLCRGYLRTAAVALSGLTFASVISLPLLRGYFFYGEYDSLTHLGWLKDLQNGALTPFDLFYPGVHEVTMLVASVTGFPLPKSLLFVVFLFPLVFVIFLSLTTFELVEDRFAATIALFSGMLLLPINQIATHYMAPHPFSETILYSVLSLYLLLVFVKRTPLGTDERLSVGLLFCLSSLAMVFFHPLQAGVFIGILGATAAVQIVSWRADSDHPLARNKPVYGLTTFHTVAFAVWTLDKPKFRGTFDMVLQEFTDLVLGTGSAAAGTVVRHQSSSLNAVGSGLGGIFLKLFLVGALFAALAGLVSVASVTGRLDGRHPEIKYLAVSVIAILPVSLLFFVGDVSKLFFRVQGSLMVLCTVLGTVGLYYLVGHARRRVSSSTVRLALAIVFGLLLIHSMAIVYTSPYMYKSNRQVTQAEYTGYEAAFAHQAEDHRFAGVRTGPNRYMHAVYGYTSVPESKHLAYHSYSPGSTVPGANVSDLDGYFDEDHYLVVTSRDVGREVVAYRGLRYSASELDSVRRQTDVHRVQSNGALRLYLYDQRGERGSETNGAARQDE